MDNRKYTDDMVSKMYDIIELVNIINRLTNDSYGDETKEYLLDIIDNMENVKYSYDKYRIRRSEPTQANYLSGYKRSGGFFDKILFYLKSLNEK